MRSKVFLDLAWIQISDFLGIGKLKHTRDKKMIRKTLLFYLSYLAVAALFIFYSFGLGKLYIDQGMADIALPLLFMASSIAVLWTSLLKSNSYLIGAKDYEMLQALPIPTGSVISCRLLVSYCIECLFGAVLLVPTGIYYGITFGKGITFYLILLLDTLFLPVIPIILATALGIVLTAVSSRFRHKNIIMIFLSLILIVGVFMFTFQTPQIAQNEFQTMSDSLLAGIFRIYPLTQLFFESLYHGTVSSTLLYAGISVLSMLVFCIVMRQSYQFLNTALLSHSVRADYKIEKLKGRSVFHALFQKEWKRYTASPLYVINTVTGYLLMLILGGFLCFSGEDSLDSIISIPGIAGQIIAALPFILGLCCSISCSTAASISIEGKNFWQTVSLPVKPSVIYNSKRAVTFIFAIPAIFISGILILTAISMDMIHAIWLFLIPLIYTWFSAEFGLFLNIHFPKFDWKSEAAIIKQGLPVFIMVFGGMAIGIAPIFLIVAVPESLRSFVTPGIGILLLAAAFLLHQIINRIQLISIRE